MEFSNALADTRPAPPSVAKFNTASPESAVIRYALPDKASSSAGAGTVAIGSL